MRAVKMLIPLFVLSIVLACSRPNAVHGPMLTQFTDTFTYLQKRVIDQKNKFVGQPMSVLVKSVGIPLKSFISMPDINHMEVSSKTDFYFEDTNMASLHTENRAHKPVLCVFWEDPLDIDSTVRLARKYYGNWSNETETYFGRRIVKDILLYQ